MSNSITDNGKFWIEPVMWFIIVSLLTILIISLSSCGSIKKVTETTTEKEVIYKVDTVTRIETVKDTTFIIEQDKASLTALVECDSNNKVILKKLIKVQQGRNLTQQIRLVRDTLILDCTQEREEFKAYYKNIYESKLSEKEQSLIKEYNRETLKRTSFINRLMWPIIMLVVGLVVGFTYKYWKLLFTVFH